MSGTAASPSSSPTTTAASSNPLATIQGSRPVSEALLNEKWDHCLSSLLVRSSLGFGFGVVFSVLLFKRRAWPALVGLGFGAGRAWEECDSTFKRGGIAIAMDREGLSAVRPSGT